MQRQGSFVEAEYAGKKKQTRRDRFVAEMEQVVPPACAGAGCGLGWWRVLPRFIRGANAVGCRFSWSGCYRFTFCSSGTRWPIRRWKKRWEPALRLDSRERGDAGFARIDADKQSELTDRDVSWN